jgi:hypothetical protein
MPLDRIDSMMWRRLMLIRFCAFLIHAIRYEYIGYMNQEIKQRRDLKIKVARVLRVLGGFRGFIGFRGFSDMVYFKR